MASHSRAAVALDRLEAFERALGGACDVYKTWLIPDKELKVSMQAQLEGQLLDRLRQFCSHHKIKLPGSNSGPAGGGFWGGKAMPLHLFPVQQHQQQPQQNQPGVTEEGVRAMVHELFNGQVLA